jgi:hypothetical protein
MARSTLPVLYFDPLCLTQHNIRNSACNHESRSADLNAFLEFMGPRPDPAVRIPMLRSLDWMWMLKHIKSNLGALANILEQAQSLQVLSLDMTILGKEPRIIDALVSGCSHVHTARLYLSGVANKSKHKDVLARLLNHACWPLRTVSIRMGSRG